MSTVSAVSWLCSCYPSRERRLWRASPSLSVRLWVCSSATPALPGRDIHVPDFSDGILRNARVVLVGTQHAGNIGSVCRAAANFECRDIYLVNACCDHQSQEGFNAAANTVSRELLCQIHAKESLSQAIENCSMAVAFTRRIGKIRLPSFSLSELIAPEHEDLKLALVFGREDCGLHTEELLQCTHVCTICTGSWQGSLNLSHAVTVVLSRLYESWVPKKLDIYETVRPDSVVYNTLPGTASVNEVENLLHRWEDVFMSCNYLAKWAGMPEFKTPDRLFLFLRKLLQRGRPSIREVAYLHGFLTVIENLAKVVSRTERSQDANS
ncbi:hypothetical protein GOP47_0012187 [Adiantum capillus-veneris]|uniref:tRNA/rRNA methyltransferase SpoU type domain-containing protein n=1 Tax=Adiantum capillus-veneris TaxID=13818 RepID=A0A9D4UQG7_ADICA|nr:hypothetical protein GOP47_0012187 [Adiantum capillus-veneris]